MHFDDVALPSEPLTNSLANDWIIFCEDGSWRGLAECPVHDEPLLIEEVPIRSGLLRFPLEYYAARRELFPFANAYVEGGCLVGPDKVAKSPYCVACRRALASWSVETGNTTGLPNDDEDFRDRYLT